MTQPKPVDGTRTPPLPEPTHFPVVDPAARNEGPPDLDNPFQDPLVPPPLVFPGGRHSSRSPVSTGRVTRIHTGGPPSDTSPVSPVVSGTSLEDYVLMIQLTADIVISESSRNKDGVQVLERTNDLQRQHRAIL